MHPIRISKEFLLPVPRLLLRRSMGKNHNIRIVGFDHTEETLSISGKGSFMAA